MELVTMDLSAQRSSDTGVLEGIMCEGQTSSAMRQKMISPVSMKFAFGCEYRTLTLLDFNKVN